MGDAAHFGVHKGHPTVPGSGGQVLMVYSARPGTRGATALSLLATLAATAAQPG